MISRFQKGILLVTLFSVMAVSSVQADEDIVGADSDFTKSFQEICVENGFGFEQHTVTTDDGYILTLFRIPGKAGESGQGKQAVFFQHGILDSADCWIMHNSSVAPAFVLSRAGYDVWLGNSRGNKYSKKHINSKIKDKQYWAFSFETMGDHDVPANIDYILSVTKQSKVAYIGHSQGTTQMFWALASNEDYFANKVSVFIATGPVLRLTHCQSDLLNFVATTDALLIDTCDLLGIYEFFPANWMTTGSMRLLCGTLPSLCEFGTYLVADENTDLDDETRLQVYMGHFPSGTSLQCLDHYGQIIRAQKFQRYDYGKKLNNEHYGQDTPPEIPIGNIKKVPVTMFVGKYDELADPQDAEWAFSQMQSGVRFYKEYDLGHLSFMVAKDMQYFTTDVLNVLHQYHPSNSVETETSFTPIE